MTGQRNKKSFIKLEKRSLVAGLLAGAMGLWGCGITDVTQDSEIVHPAGEDTITPIDDSLIVVGYLRWEVNPYGGPPIPIPFRRPLLQKQAIF